MKFARANFVDRERRFFKGVKNIIYDSDVKVYLSDRRFTERGFLTILGIWARGSVRAIFGQQFSG